MISSSEERLGEAEGRLAASVPQNVRGGLTEAKPSQDSARLANAGRVTPGGSGPEQLGEGG